MRKQLKLFFTALMFLTRIPCPTWEDQGGHASEGLAASSLYFPLVGLLVGGSGAIVYRLIVIGYSPLVASLFGIAATAIITGAFHEDAFADVCDGFGGWTPKRRLEIMRDSRVGSFGVMGLVLLIGIKAALLSEMPPARATVAFLVGHAFGRWSMLVMMGCFRTVTGSASLAKPFAAAITLPRFAFGTLTAAAAGLLVGPATAAALLLLTPLFCLCAGRFFSHWIGGISGDCIGAVNQVVEMLGYAVIVHAAALEAGLHVLGRR